MTTKTDMLKIATNFYKYLFGFEPKANIHLDTTFWSEQEKLTSSEVEALEKNLFLKKKLKMPLWDLIFVGLLALMVCPFFFTKPFGILLKMILCL